LATVPQKKHFTFTLKDFHKEFKLKKKKEGLAVKDIIEYKEHKRVMESFFRVVFKKMIHENFVFTMPYSLGAVLIKGYRANPDNLAIDFQNTIKHKKLIYFINRHSFGYCFKIWWNKTYVKFRHQSYYIFKAISSKYAHRQGIGRSALGKHIIALSKDPEKRSFIRL